MLPRRINQMHAIETGDNMNVIPELDPDSLQATIGREARSRDVLTARIATALWASLHNDLLSFPEGAIAPPAIHWCLAPQITALADAGPDGHTASRGLLPEIPLPRRMWAGGELRFLEPLRIGDTIERVSRIAGITAKHGRTGPLLFVTIAHQIFSPRGVAIEERQDLVFRGADAPAISPTLEAPPTERKRTGCADPVLLFRYSALTFNSHRIHYDYPYVTEKEHYPGLIVHGPLQATWLIDFATEIRAAVPKRFAFRGLSPLFAGQNYSLGAREQNGELELWVQREEGGMTMRAEAEW